MKNKKKSEKITKQILEGNYAKLSDAEKVEFMKKSRNDPDMLLIGELQGIIKNNTPTR